MRGRSRAREFSAEIRLPAPLNKVFPFFADAANLQVLTPPWLHFEILSPVPVELRLGTLIDYRLRLLGLPIRWRTRISGWNPPHQFVDEQLRGPYRQWIHTHTFEPSGEGTVVRDHVRYAVALDFLVHDWLVRPDLERIFGYRAETLHRVFSNFDAHG